MANILSLVIWYLTKYNRLYIARWYDYLESAAIAKTVRLCDNLFGVHYVGVKDKMKRRNGLRLLLHLLISPHREFVVRMVRLVLTAKSSKIVMSPSGEIEIEVNF